MAKTNTSRFAILGMLSLKSSSGYDIKKMMERSTGYFWKESDASIYPILKQLLLEKLVTCVSENTDSNRPKKMYKITDEGAEELHQWLCEDPILSQNRNEFLLKVFFGWNVDRDITINHIKKFQVQVKASNDRYKRIQADAFPNEYQLTKDKLHRFLTLRAGMMYTQASLEWCEEAIQLLQNNRKEII